MCACESVADTTLVYVLRAFPPAAFVQPEAIVEYDVVLDVFVIYDLSLSYVDASEEDYSVNPRPTSPLFLVTLICSTVLYVYVEFVLQNTSM